MALFKLRQEYLETRILTFDPEGDLNSNRKSRRHKGNPATKGLKTVLAASNGAGINN